MGPIQKKNLPVLVRHIVYISAALAIVGCAGVPSALEVQVHSSEIQTQATSSQSNDSHTVELQTQQEIQHIEERREARFNAYIRNTMHAVEDGDFDIAEFELNKAELIRISSETRSLRNAIRDGRKRGHLIHLAHVFLEENNYKEAVEHAERANEIAATEDVEILIRQIRCQMLISEACELEAAGQNAKAVLLLKTALWLHEDRRAREMLNRLEGSPATQPAEDGKR